MKATISIPAYSGNNKHRLIKKYVECIAHLIGIPYKSKTVDTLSTIMYYIHENKNNYLEGTKFNFDKFNVDLTTNKIRNDIRELIPKLYDNPTYRHSIEIDHFKVILGQLRAKGCFRDNKIAITDEIIEEFNMTELPHRNSRTILLVANVLFNFIYKDFTELDLTMSFKIDEPKAK